MTGRGWARALVAYGVALALANLGLAAWLRLGGAAVPGGEDVVSAWRGGARVARRVGAGVVAGPGIGAGTAGGGLASEGATPGTTVVLERIVGEARVLTLGRRLFGLSFVAGRDGARAGLEGREALLTPDDLVVSGLYRPTGLDADGVLVRLAAELGCSPERLWQSGRFRRFSVVRTVLSSSPAPAPSPPSPPKAGDTTPTIVVDANWVGTLGAPSQGAANGGAFPVAAAIADAANAGAANAGATNAAAASAGATNPGGVIAGAGATGAIDTTPTGPRLAVAVRQTAAYLVRPLLPNGRFADTTDAATGALREAEPYDWERHGVVTAFLAEAAARLDDLGIRIAAQRAGWALRTAVLGRCGGEACVDAGPRVETGASAAALLAFSGLAAERVGAPFREPVRALAAFLRGQQRPDGGFWSGYDRVRQAPEGSGRGDVDAAVVLALVRSYRITRDPADRAAASRGLDRLARPPGWLGVRDPFAADPRLCAAADELAALGAGAGTGGRVGAETRSGAETAIGDPAAGAAARALCLDATASAAVVQLGTAGPVGDYAGGFRAGVGWMPDLRATAAWTEASTAALAIGLRAGRSVRALTPLGTGVTHALELMLREQLPGARPYLIRDPVAVAGAFSTSPVDMQASIDVSAAAGSALLRYLELLEARGLPAASQRRSRK